MSLIRLDCVWDFHVDFLRGILCVCPQWEAEWSVSEEGQMEGKGPYRIYDPGGGEAQAKVEVEAASYQQLLEENNVLRERMKGLKSLGDLLEESQTEASKLRQRVEELVKDNEALRSSSASFSSSVCVGLPVQTEAQAQGNDEQPSPEPAASPNLDAGSALRPESSEGSSEFEVVNLDGTESGGENVKLGGGIRLPQETTELTNQLQKLESSFSVFTEESNPNQLMAHLGRMALEFNHLSSKVQKNEQRTSLLQTLCEQLRNENNELRKKMEDDLRYRNEDMELLRQENVRLKKLVTATGEPMGIQLQGTKPAPVKPEPVGAKMEVVITQQSGKATEKSPTKTCDPEVYEKKIKMLEKQRKDVLEVNKQWDIQWNSMKLQFEQKITDLRQRLADSQKAVLELEAEREQKQRDYDKKLLLAKSKIETVQGEKECLTSETCELKHKLRYMQDQLLPLSKQKEYQDKEIQRLNRALEEALDLHSPSSTAQQPGFGNHGEGAVNLRRQDLLTQIAVLKEQVKIFEEDFQKERSDRERMNEEKEDLKRQVERFQGQITNLTNQLHQAQNECQRERTERCKLERLHMHLKQGQHERRTSDPTSGSANAPISPPYCGPFVQAGHQGFDGWQIHFPPRIPNLSVAPGREFPPFQPGFAWQPPGPQQRGVRGAGDSARPPPENTDPTAGFGKRDRQNIDPGKH